MLSGFTKLRLCLRTLSYNCKVSFSKRTYIIKKPFKAHDNFGDTQKLGKHNDYAEPDDIFSAFSDKLFENLSENDKTFSNEIITARRSGTDDGQILLEGHRLITDALLAGGKMNFLFFSKRDSLRGLPHLCPEAQIFHVPYRTIRRWSGLSTPQGLMAIFKKPDYEVISKQRLADEKQPLPVSLICDNVRDPGNMGTLIRTAAAINVDQILLTKGCVDAWNPKVMQSGMGAHFHVPILSRLSWSDVVNNLDKAATVHLADNALSSKKAVLTFTNEDMREKDDTSSDSEDDYQSSDSDLDADEVSDCFNLPIPIRRYYDVVFTESRQPCAIVVGGETEALSPRAFKMCHARYGSRIYIPINPTIDSLNSAVAGSVVLCEIQRQWLSLLEQDDIRTKL